MNDITQEEQRLAALLATRGERGIAANDLEALPLPDSVESACRIQHEILRLRASPLKAWKVGAPNPEADGRGAPLPMGGVHSAPLALDYAQFSHSGYELEIAFILERDFNPRTQDYTAAEVFAGVGGFCAAVELVSSRFAQWPQVDALLQLADLQNHGALVLGEPVPYREDFDFVHPALSFSFEGSNISKPTPANPAGDPRRLLVWLINDRVRQGEAVVSGTVVTTGSYTGMYFPGKPGRVRGEIVGLPPLEFSVQA